MCVCTHTHTHIYPAICMREYTHTYVACRTAFGIGIYLLYCLASVWRGGADFGGTFQTRALCTNGACECVCVFLRHAACCGLRGDPTDTPERTDLSRRNSSAPAALAFQLQTSPPNRHRHSAIIIIIIIVIDSLNHACALISRYV